MSIAAWQLKQRQSLPLDIKVKWAVGRIRQWVDEFGEGGVYVSLSGKDSAVLWHLVHEVCKYKRIPAVFSNTGLEYPEVVRFAREMGAEFVRPKMTFRAVLEKYGYPVISKESAQYIEEARVARSHGNDAWVQRRLYGRPDKPGQYCLSKKWHYLMDAPFLVSAKCCDIIKKKPLGLYAKKTGRHAMLGVMAADSKLRKSSYLRHGCNTFQAKEPKSCPMGIWTEQDVLQYIFQNELTIPEVYGQVLCRNGAYTTTGADRTGCIFCAFGAHLEKPPNRFERLAVSHPKLWRYCMDKLGMREVLEHVGVVTGEQK